MICAPTPSTGLTAPTAPRRLPRPIQVSNIHIPRVRPLSKLDQAARRACVAQWNKEYLAAQGGWGEGEGKGGLR
jgi:hypothetical protein